MSIFETLNKINVNEHTEKKNGLTYLSWAWAWAEVKKAFPDATYTIYENKDVQRSLTKAVARHGLGLYVYAGEDLPEAEQTPVTRQDEQAEIALLKKQILALGDDDLVRINNYISRLFDGQLNDLESLNVEQLRRTKVAIAKARNK